MTIRRVDDTSSGGVPVIGAPVAGGSRAPEASPVADALPASSPVAEVRRGREQDPLAEEVATAADRDRRSGEARVIGAPGVLQFTAKPVVIRASTQPLEERLVRAAAPLTEYERGYASTLALLGRGHPERLGPMIRTLESPEFRRLAERERLELMATISAFHDHEPRLQNIPRAAQLYAGESFRAVDTGHQGFVKGIMATALADPKKIDQLEALLSSPSFRALDERGRARALAGFAANIERSPQHLARVQTMTDIAGDANFRRLDPLVRGRAETLLAIHSADTARFELLRAALTSAALAAMPAEQQHQVVVRLEEAAEELARLRTEVQALAP